MTDTGHPVQDDALNVRAVRYFRAQAELYDERYRVQAGGDVLWDRHCAIIRMVNGIKLTHDSRILDLGCGPGILCLDLAKIGHRGIGLDAAPQMIRRCRISTHQEQLLGAWQYTVGNVEGIPFADNSFDLVVCSGVIDYLSSDDKLLREASRVLKPGGYFILSVTNKFGYTVSLSGLTYAIKRFPGMVRLASAIRRLIIGGQRGVMSFDFQPRKRRPASIRKSLRSFGFEVDVDQYLQFTVVPAPLCYLFSRFRRPIISHDATSRLDRTVLRIFGSCYLLRSRLKK